MTSKKAIIISVSVVLIICAVLFVPIPGSVYDDGGTREYNALTYKIVVWNRLTGSGVYRHTSVYWFGDRYKSIDELWDMKKESAELSEFEVLSETAENTLASENRKSDLLIPERSIRSISVSSLPELMNYRFTDKVSIGRIVDYFNSLHLMPDSDYEPDGMAWRIEITFSDGSGMTLYHICNIFVRAAGGERFTISYEEAQRFEELLGELKN